MSNGNDTHRKSSRPGSRTASSTMGQSGLTYLPSTVHSLEEWWTLLRRDSLASPIASPEKDEGLETSATSGLIPRESLARYDPATSSWRTCQGSLLTGISELYSDRFPKSGTTASGALYPLPTPEPHTSESGGGVLPAKWPTPTATERTNDVTATPSQATLDRFHAGEIARVRKTRSPTLTTAVNEGQRMWPTPRSSDVAAKMTMDNVAKRIEKTGYHSNLEEAVAMQTWPTPTVSDHKGSGPTIIRKDGKSRMDRLDYVTEQTSEVGGQLNPQWVTWLMGLPLGWVSLDPLPAEEYQEWCEAMTSGEWWTEERGLPRVAPSHPNRVNQLKALGNGIVPGSAAEFLLRTK
jgi:hypothetical protein